MVNEDILTALRNSVERGESLDIAMKILINSGYNPKEVQEASKFVGSGAIDLQKINPDEHLAMPSKKGFFSRNQTEKNNLLIKKQEASNEIQQIKQSVSPQTNYQPYPSPSNSNLSSQLKEISPRKSYFKEIILLIILLVLIGVLIATIWFKPQIVNFFSGA